MTNYSTNKKRIGRDGAGTRGGRHGPKVQRWKGITNGAANGAARRASNGRKSDGHLAKMLIEYGRWLNESDRDKDPGLSETKFFGYKLNALDRAQKTISITGLGSLSFKVNDIKRLGGNNNKVLSAGRVYWSNASQICFTSKDFPVRKGCIAIFSFAIYEVQRNKLSLPCLQVMMQCALQNQQSPKLLMYVCSSVCALLPIETTTARTRNTNGVSTTLRWSRR